MTVSSAVPPKSDRRARRRLYLPGRAALSWLISALEALVAASMLVFAMGLGPGFGLLGLFFFIGFTFPAWYLFLGGQTRFAPMLISAVGAWLLAAAIAVVPAALMVAVDLRLALVSGLVGLAVVTGLRALVALVLVQVVVQGQIQFEKLGIVGPADEIKRFVETERIWQRGLQPRQFHPSETPDAGALRAFIDDCITHGCTQILFLSEQVGLSRAQLRDICDHHNIDAFLATTPFDPDRVDWISERPVGFTGAVFKRLFDLVAASLLLLILSPFLLVVALAIRLETPGASLFRQERMGFNGRSFMIYKFRSMRVMEAGHAMVQATRGDARITRVGRFIRATSIDELPQLLNVLRGDMSLVGPRPHAISHDDEMDRSVARYAHRNRLKPGITGWAQVNGYRGETSTQEKMEGRVAHDLYYIENWSPWLDVKILLLTAFSRKARQNAF